MGCIDYPCKLTFDARQHKTTFNTNKTISKYTSFNYYFHILFSIPSTIPFTISKY